MRVLIQRTRSARVSVGAEVIGEINAGLVLLVGIGHADSEITCQILARKVLDLRIFEDVDGKMNHSFRDMNAAEPGKWGLLVISQFTLYADTRKGRRPSFTQAAEPSTAVGLLATLVAEFRKHGAKVTEGRFGAHMVVGLENDGPVTIWLDTDE